MELTWGKCQGDIWCSFTGLKLDNPVFDHAIGVYIIWSGTVTIKVGGGKIKDEIGKDRRNQTILAYPSASLKVTWCHVNNLNIKEVQKYLIDRLHPVITEQIKGVQGRNVNLPWV